RRALGPETVRDLRRPEHALALAQSRRGVADRCEPVALEADDERVVRPRMLIDRRVWLKPEERDKESGFTHEDFALDTDSALAPQRAPLGTRHRCDIDAHTRRIPQQSLERRAPASHHARRRALRMRCRRWDSNP